MDLSGKGHRTTSLPTPPNYTDLGLTHLSDNFSWAAFLPSQGSTDGLLDFDSPPNASTFLPDNSSLLSGSGGIGNRTVSHDLNTFRWANVALVTLFCSIIAGTVIGNTLVIAAVATTRRLRTVTNCFVMSLAVADWLVGMFVMPIKVVVHLSNNVWHFGYIICQIWLALDVLLCTSSILSLCTISIDRYLAITRPLAYSRKRRSKRLALSMISCVWVGSLLITSPPMLGWNAHDLGDGQCKYNDDQVYVVYSAMGSFFLPLLIMLYVYARIACVIAQRQNSILKTHKSKDKKSYGSEETIGGDEMVAQSKKSERKGPGSSDTKSSTTFHFFTKSASQQKQKSATSFWTRFRRLNKSSFKSKSEQANHRSSGDEAEGGSHRSEIPSPSTIRSMGNGKNGIPKILPASAAGNEYGRQGIGGVNNGASRITRTGSRLCNHSLTNCSPPRSIAHRIQPSSSTRVSVFSEGDIAMRTRGGCRKETLPGRVWTVEDEEEELEKQEQLLAHTTLSLNTATNGRSACGCPAVSSRPEENHATSSRFNYAPQRQQQLHAHLLKSSSSHVVRSRSVKVHLTFNSADHAQGSAGRDFSSGRVASFKRETKTAQTLAAVVGGFIICWLPFFVTYVLGPFLTKGSIPHELMEAFIWLGWGNSAINPFIYAFYSADFRSAFWRLTIQKCNGLLRSGRSPDRSSPKRKYYYHENPGRLSQRRKQQRFSHPTLGLAGHPPISAQPSPPLLPPTGEDESRAHGNRAKSV